MECLQILQTLAKGENKPCSICGCIKSTSTGICYQCFDNYGKQNKMIKTPWYNHPAVQMWKGYEITLIRYGWHICEEWIKRGFKDNLKHRILNFVPIGKNVDDAIYPSWIGNKLFLLSHKSNLIRKKPDYYIPLFGKEIPNNLPYVWPTKQLN